MTKKVSTADIDKLNDLLIREFGWTLKNPPVDENGNRLSIPASALAVITKYIVSSGIRPTADSPAAARIAEMMKDLPFKDSDEQPSKVN
jgi:hypothetical protein